MSSSVRHDWYQTDEKVVITVLVKNAKHYDVQIQPRDIHIEADDYTLDLKLFAAINQERSTYRIVPVKVEVTLFKLVGERWPVLEAPAAALDSDAPVAAVDLLPAKVVKIYKQDWDSVEKQIEKEEEENTEVRAHVVLVFRGYYNYPFLGFAGRCAQQSLPEDL